MLVSDLPSKLLVGGYCYPTSAMKGEGGERNSFVPHWLGGQECPLSLERKQAAPKVAGASCARPLRVRLAPSKALHPLQRNRGGGLQPPCPSPKSPRACIQILRFPSTRYRSKLVLIKIWEKATTNIKRSNPHCNFSVKTLHDEPSPSANLPVPPVCRCGPTRFRPYQPSRY